MTYIYTIINSEIDALQLQLDLYNFQLWCITNKMNLNIIKGIIISFAYKKTKNYYDNNLGNPSLNDYVYDLGIYFDEKFNINSHIDKLKN